LFDHWRCTVYGVKSTASLAVTKASQATPSSSWKLLKNSNARWFWSNPMYAVLVLGCGSVDASFSSWLASSSMSDVWKPLQCGMIA
jgi:hypothetical protein